MKQTEVLTPTSCRTRDCRLAAPRQRQQLRLTCAAQLTAEQPGLRTDIDWDSLGFGLQHVGEVRIGAVGRGGRVVGPDYAIQFCGTSPTPSTQVVLFCDIR